MIVVIGRQGISGDACAPTRLSGHQPCRLPPEQHWPLLYGPRRTPQPRVTSVGEAGMLWQSARRGRATSRANGLRKENIFATMRLSAYARQDRRTANHQETSCISAI